MDKVLSVFFNTDRTYVGLVERSENGVTLLDINSTANPIDIQDISSEISEKAILELHEIIEGFGDFDVISISFPSDYAISVHIPGDINSSHDELKKTIALELEQLYTNASLSNFHITCHPVFSNDDNKKCSVNLISQEDIDNCKKIFSRWKNKPVINIEIAQTCAQKSVLFNYPEKQDEATVVIGIQNNFIDFLAFKNHNILHSHLINYNSVEDLPDIFLKGLATIMEEQNESISTIYLYGIDLVKDINITLWENAMLEGLEAKRLNPFRMVHNKLTPRQKEYSTKVFHLFPAIIGSVLPNGPNVLVCCE